MATSKTTSKAAAATKEFPAKAGHPDVEVAERSTDGSEGTRHVKDFVILARDWSGTDAQHEAYRTAAANEAIQRGLHPRGDVSFDGSQDHPDGVSLVLTYSVDTVPSSVDHTPQATTTPRDVIEAD